MNKSSSYQPAVMTQRVAAAAAGGPALFQHAAAKVAVDILDPKKLNKAGKNIRESRDSDVSPRSVAIGVIFDGTGSMYEHPALFAKKLPSLMTAIVKDGIIENPQILFGQVCDYADSIPLQLGQFESDNQIDTSLTSMATPGGGAGSNYSYEAYETILWYMATHVEMDCLEKRGEKGWLFMIGDEMTNDCLTPKNVEKIFGLTIKDPISREDILAAVKKKFNVHWIMPSGTMHFDDQRVRDHLTQCWGENVHYLEDPSAICECITGIIAACEGFDIDQINTTLVGMGGGSTAAAAASSAVVAYMGRAQLTKTGKGTSSAELVAVDEDEGSNRL